MAVSKLFLILIFVSGRTGRAGKTGTAVSFFVVEKNARLARELKEILERTEQHIPDEVKANANFVGKRGGNYGPRSGGNRRW